MLAPRGRGDQYARHACKYRATSHHHQLQYAEIGTWSGDTIFQFVPKYRPHVLPLMII